MLQALVVPRTARDRIRQRLTAGAVKEEGSTKPPSMAASASASAVEDVVSAVEEYFAMIGRDRHLSELLLLSNNADGGDANDDADDDNNSRWNNRSISRNRCELHRRRFLRFFGI